MKICCILAVASLFISSCSTAFVRGGGDDGFERFYPATTFNAGLVWEASIKGNLPIAMAEDEEKAPIVSRLMFLVGGVVDLPFSVAFDTLLLPWDIARYFVRSDDDGLE